MERALATLGAAVVVVVYAIGIGEPLSNYEEPVFAEMIRAMGRTGDVLTLTYQGAETLHRPPTVVWFYALVAQGVPGDVGLRLGALVFTLLSAFGAGIFVARRYRDRWAGFLTGGACVGVPSVYLYGRLLLLDPPFVFAVVVAVASTMVAQREPRYVVWAAAALGAAFALAGVTAAVPLLCLAPWLVVAWRRHGEAARPRRALAWFAALALPIFVVGFAVHGARFWHEYLAINTLDWATGELEPVLGLGGADAYVRHLWLADGPFAALLLCGGVVGAAAYAIHRRDAELGVAATAAAGTLLLLTLVGTRLARHLLLFYPLAAICVGALFARGGPRFGRYARPLRALAWSVAVAVFAVAIAGEPYDRRAAPSWAAKELSLTTLYYSEPGERLYVVDWYAPAFGYYSDGPFTMLTTSPAHAAVLGGSPPFAQAGNVAAAPPWPEGDFWLAGPEREFPPPGLEIVRLTAGCRGYRLAKVRAAP